MSEQSKVNVLKGRRVSLEGARLIGTGATAKVYLLPDDNVIKVLFSTDYQEAEREILLSKWAFSKGIATAISYDVADVDGHPGLVYESLGRNNLRNELRAHSDNLQPLLEKYLSFLHALNSIEVPAGQLPSAKQQTLHKVQQVKAYLTEAEYARVLELVETVPEDSHLVHGDCHMKNIKVVNGQLFLIDLDTLSTGDPIFELEGLCCCYHAYSACNCDADGYNAFLDIDNGIVHTVYHYLLDNYFTGPDEASRKENVRKIELLTYICMLYNLNPENPDEKELFADMLGRVQGQLYTVRDFILKR